MATIFKLLWGYYLLRAVLRGPGYLLPFLVRRQLRRAANRGIRRVR